ncbi:MAG: FtsQ-type POTRA domain-containing protein [Patescibacteria group bacterium]
MKKSQYQSRNRKKRLSLKKVFFAGLFFCLLGVVIYFAVWSPYFWIKQINIEQAETILEEKAKELAEEKLELKLTGFIPRKSIFLVSLSEIRIDILEEFSEIKQVDFSRQMPDKLAIKIFERKQVGIWCQVQELSTSTPEKINQCYYFDQEGVIFKKSPLIKNSLMVNIFSDKSPVKIRDRVLDSEMIDFILAIRQDLPRIKTASSLILEAIDFETISLGDLRATTNYGWQIYFNPSYSVSSQLEALRVVLAEQIKEGVNDLEYLDLRIEGRVYYK